jgi:ABC-type antimicrobial peptide transport system permease subunit
MTVTVRIAPGMQAPIDAIRTEVLALDPHVPMRGVETLQEVVGREVAPTRLYLALILGFAGVAVFLTAVGLYGVVAYLVSRRTREIGIRMALGVRGSAIIREVSIQGLLPAGIGMVLGLAASVASARLLASLLFGVTPQDPWVLLGASGLVMIVSCFASLIPALRALGVDPVTVMRAE